MQTPALFRALSRLRNILRAATPAHAGPLRLGSAFWLLLAALAVATPAPAWIDFNKNGQLDVYEDASQPVERRVDDLLSQMSVEEKTCQLATLYGYGRVLKDPLPTPGWKNAIWKDGIGNIDEMHNGIGRYPSSPYNESPEKTIEALNTLQRWFIEETRLGIPVDFTNEGIRGLNYVRSTNFPANIGIGASFDRELSSRLAAVVAREARAIGYTHIYAPIMDLARDPRWGRVVETFGEDPYLVTELGIRMARGLQEGGVSASAKHFAVYSEPKGARDGAARTDPHVAPREMEMLHLVPWERLVKETGLRGVMSSYNDYDGVPVSGSHEFLVDRLRTAWGFKGYVVSDSEAVEFLQTKHRVVATYPEAAAMFVREGGNVRTNFTPPDATILGLREQIATGKLSREVVDSRVRDVLRVKFAAGIFDRPYVQDVSAAAKILRAPEHQSLALEAAKKSLVLLKNENATLPLSPKLKRILVCGPTATLTETSFDRYGSNGGKVVSPLEGIQARLAGTGTEIVFAEGCTVTGSRWPESELFPQAPSGTDAAMIADAVAKAATADAIVVFVGDSNATIGESKSRTSLDLPGHQNALVQALVETGRPVVAVLMIGRPATVNYIQRSVPAIVAGWFPGEAGGTAIAGALFGDFSPGGKLPVTFPRTVGQLPLNFPYKPGSHAAQSRKDDPNGFGEASIEGALYPFGHGLSYTTFAYSNLEITPRVADPNGEITVACTVTNTGSVTGDEVAQLYFRDLVSSVTTYDYNLVGFERVQLEPGRDRRVQFKIPAARLTLIDRSGRRVVEPGDFRIWVGSSSTDLRLTGDFNIKTAPLNNMINTAFAAASKQYETLLARLPDDGKLPRTAADGKVVTVPTGDWTSGFFPGALWYLFEATRDSRWIEPATRYTKLLAAEQSNNRTHDIGFMLYCSYGNALRLANDPAAKGVLLNGARALNTRFNPKVGAIRSWDGNHWKYPVIIDNMINLELLFWAARESKDDVYRQTAIAHADTTLKNHFRPDGSSFHVVDYDPATGAVLKQQTHQGTADSSAWARGQAWALYGYTLMYRETRQARYLEQAQKIAGFLINHPRLPADKIPYWDFDAPGIPNAPRDTAAAAIICSALYELSELTGAEQGAAYARFAEAQLRSLASPEYLATDGSNGGFLLRHATGHHPKNSEIDVPLIYADYYFLEALLRARTLSR